MGTLAQISMDELIEDLKDALHDISILQLARALGIRTTLSGMDVEKRLDGNFEQAHVILDEMQSRIKKGEPN